MGIGLIFWGVSEPLLHYDDPPLGLAEPKTPEAADLAMQYSFFHWTLHPWGIYAVVGLAVVGLAVAYLSYNKGIKDLRISRAMRPLLGDRVEGPIGAAIDVLAIVATLFGVAVSLGLGTLQLDAGLDAAFGATSGTTLQLIIIGVTAAGYMLSASTPIEKGINWLSQASMVLAAIMLVLFFVLGPSILQLNAMTEGTGRYIGQLIPTSLRMSAFDPDPWLGDWTVFFWATWIAWAPYVGVFIARISRGRTIREFILGVLIAPSIFSMIWFSVFGSTALDLDNQLGGALSAAATRDEAVALFTFLEQYPLAIITSTLFIILIWIFFVAGADAGTVVLGSMSAGGALDPSVFVRLVWGAVMAALAAILLVAGGLPALQNGAILAATPFAFIMVALCWSLQRTLSGDYRKQMQARGDQTNAPPPDHRGRHHERPEPVPGADRDDQRHGPHAPPRHDWARARVRVARAYPRRRMDADDRRLLPGDGSDHPTGASGPGPRRRRHHVLGRGAERVRRAQHRARPARGGLLAAGADVRCVPPADQPAGARRRGSDQRRVPQRAGDRDRTGCLRLQRA